METISLNEQQLDMIRLLRKPLPREQFMELRQLVVQLLAKQLDDVIEEWEAGHDITEEDYLRLSKEHHRRTGKHEE